jgi:MFS family permease
VLLIYPTAVIAIAAEWQLDYGKLIGLAAAAFVAFGLFSLPMGWIAERFGRRNLLAVFFVGTGLSCLGLSTAYSPVTLAFWLLVLGIFSAIYHPIGSAMLVSHARQLGCDLGLAWCVGQLGSGARVGGDSVHRVHVGLAGCVCHTGTEFHCGWYRVSCDGSWRWGHGKA